MPPFWWSAHSTSYPRHTKNGHYSITICQPSYYCCDTYSRTVLYTASLTYAPDAIGAPLMQLSVITNYMIDTGPKG